MFTPDAIVDVGMHLFVASGCLQDASRRHGAGLRHLETKPIKFGVMAGTAVEANSRS